MAKYIGIDYGTKRVGIAISDELGMIASPLEAIHANDLLTYLANKIEKEKIENIVIGMPIGLRGEDTNLTNKVREVVVHLKRKLPGIKIHLADERFTSKMAGMAMVTGNLSKSKRREKGMIDKVSAALILQSFLDNKSK